ncbi:MAG: hypothetical protein ACYS9Y_05830 [Planctomycetota bacterium]|jgi:hypothetical protein
MSNKSVSRRQFLLKTTLTAGVFGISGAAALSKTAKAQKPTISDLEKRINTYGPFPPTRRKIVIFSTGNDYEDHGPALAAASDTHFAQAFCTGAALRTGIRYLAHAPFTTDLAGQCSKLFCPVYLPAQQYFDKTADFCTMILDAVKPRPEGVLILVPWHGQHIMAEKIDVFAKRLRVKKARLIPDIVGDAAMCLIRADYKDSKIRELVQEAVEGNIFQHAGLLDYSVAEALGHLDRAKLDLLRKEMEQDLEKALRKYPAVSSQAGYIRYGGKEFDGLRKAYGLKPTDPFPAVDPKWQNSCPTTGRAIVKKTIDIAVETILDFEKELFGNNLWEKKL